MTKEKMIHRIIQFVCCPLLYMFTNCFVSFSFSFIIFNMIKCLVDFDVTKYTQCYLHIYVYNRILLRWMRRLGLLLIILSLWNQSNVNRSLVWMYKLFYKVWINFYHFRFYFSFCISFWNFISFGFIRRHI